MSLAVVVVDKTAPGADVRCVVDNGGIVVVVVKTSAGCARRFSGVCGYCVSSGRRHSGRIKVNEMRRG